MGSIIDDFEGIAARLRQLEGRPKKKKTLGQSLEEALEATLAESDEAQAADPFSGAPTAPQQGTLRNRNIQQRGVKCVMCEGRGRRPDPRDPLITEECQFCCGTGLV